MWGTKPKSIETPARALEPILAASAAEAEPKGKTTCCGKPMTPHFGQARDRLGQVVFVAIWRCTTCRRVAF